MRKKIVAGNWKMNTGKQEALQLVQDVLSSLSPLAAHQHLVFCPPFVHISSIQEVLRSGKSSNVHLGAQNCHDKASGAYTGEVSIPMLRDYGVDHVIIGHSERRQYFNESNEFIRTKVDALLAEGMRVLFCCGEPLEIRESGTQNDWVKKQLEESVFHLSPEQMKQGIIIAYEPIWAIGTGKTASSEQAQEMQAFIRHIVRTHFGESVADELSILYGGSCNAGNAAELFACPDVDGGLIGGAALKAETFLPIVAALR